jgi:hypothetical protein
MLCSQKILEKLSRRFKGHFHFFKRELKRSCSIVGTAHARRGEKVSAVGTVQARRGEKVSAMGTAHARRGERFAGFSVFIPQESFFFNQGFQE